MPSPTPDPWEFLQAYTPARLAQGRAGVGLPTRALLAFQLDHARARDAVYSQLDATTLPANLRATGLDVLTLGSQAPDRRTYLQRPDLGRQLSNDARARLDARRSEPADLSIVVVDGLSATAVNRHAGPVVAGLVEGVRPLGWRLAPLVLIEQGRVAIGDDVAHRLRADLVVVLIGERPGLTSPDSLGAYLTYRPRPGLTDEARNCVSNIRTPGGLPYPLAVQKLLYLLTEMKTRRLSGVELKDEWPGDALPAAPQNE